MTVWTPEGGDQWGYLGGCPPQSTRPLRSILLPHAKGTHILPNRIPLQGHLKAQVQLRPLKCSFISTAS